MRLEEIEQLIKQLLQLPEITSKTSLAIGADIVALGTMDISELTLGKTYKALHGLEEGIFKSRPFVTVINDEGKRYICHASRFRLPA